MRKRDRTIAAWLVAVAIAVAVAGCCKSESSDTKEDSAAVATTSASASATTVEPEASAAPVASDASVEAEAPKPPPTATANPARALKACCAALQGAAAKASMPDKTSYASAAAVCNGLVPAVEKGRVSAEGAKLTVRAQLQRVKSIPGACR